jgi:replicative DNA helicase
MQEKGSKDNHNASKSIESIADKKEKELQKAKFLVTDVMKKIDAKNISEELNPITNQAILRKINQMDSEIEQLKVEAENKENSLITNPNNQLLRN